MNQELFYFLARYGLLVLCNYSERIVRSDELLPGEISEDLNVIESDCCCDDNDDGDNANEFNE